jgi:outer membrane protein assembly factor BamE (lipoprotein component of BamABCDE complex)
MKKIILAVLLLSGCNYTGRLNEYGFQKIGNNIENVIFDLGPPSQVFEGDHFNYYVFEKQRVETHNKVVSGQHVPDPVIQFLTGNKEAMATYESESESEEKVHFCNLTFKTDKHNTVKSFKVKGKCDYHTSLIQE